MVMLTTITMTMTTEMLAIDENENENDYGSGQQHEGIPCRPPIRLPGHEVTLFACPHMPLRAILDQS
eukprot:246137-Amphidinium_carterae.1